MLNAIVFTNYDTRLTNQHFKKHIIRGNNLMNTLTNLLKDRQVGTWCKRAAWFILAIGLVEIALDIYNVSRQFGYGSLPSSF